MEVKYTTDFGNPGSFGHKTRISPVASDRTSKPVDGGCACMNRLPGERRELRVPFQLTARKNTITVPPSRKYIPGDPRSPGRTYEWLF